MFACNWICGEERANSMAGANTGPDNHWFTVGCLDYLAPEVARGQYLGQLLVTTHGKTHY